MSNLRTLTKSARWETTHHGMIVSFSFLSSFICFRVLFYFIVLNLEFCITFILALHSAYCIIKKKERTLPRPRHMCVVKKRNRTESHAVAWLEACL